MWGARNIRRGLVASIAAAALFGCAIDRPRETPPATAAVEHAEPPLIELPAVEATAIVAPPPVVAPRPDLWRRIGDGLTLTAPPAHRPADPFDLFQYGRKAIAAATARSAPYLYHITRELDRRELPYEIALIPILESGYNAAAVSPAGPAGLWQLIPATARRFGLTRTRWYDGRRDVVASTHAALDYLSTLGERFDGDWLLALAAYNCGERTVEEAVARNRAARRPTDFWSLELPRVTERYVPRLLALADIMRDPARHGIEVPVIADEPYFEEVDVGGNRHLARMVSDSGFSAAEFAALNAAFPRGVTSAAAPSRILVRPGHADDLVLALASAGPALAWGGDSHTVRPGETLSHIAARAGVTVEALRTANGLASSRLQVGQVLQLPTGGQPLAEGDEGEDEPRVAAQVHVVAAGDNLWTIAQRYHTSSRALARLNGLERSAVLRAGQTLQLPRGATAAVARADAAPTHYEVRAGDSLWTISRRFKVTVAQLRKWNALSGKPLLQPGQRLVVYRTAGDDAQREI
jgi:membrane-bound lytic murein transglycosylase D